MVCYRIHKNIIMNLQLFVCVFSLFCLFSYAEQIESLTFQPPFTEVDHAGQRLASRDWRSSGTTVVNNNFIRLTPDRQSKKGALWSRRALNVPSFSSLLKFRISGQGKNFFGDGIGFWITQQGYYAEGDLHGSQEKFVGVGIIVDTFKNTENLAAHRDVTILINNGEKTYEMMTKDVLGCNAVLRYHAERADFSVSDSSRLKVVVNGAGLTVAVDPKSNGEWTNCVELADTGLGPNWASKAHIGITATTGQLADNHDIISLATYTELEQLENHDIEESNRRHFELGNTMSVEEKLSTLESAVNNLLKEFENRDHSVEHEFASVSDSIKNLIGKLEKREELAEGRIEQLEQRLKQMVDGSLDERISSLETYVKKHAERKLELVEMSLDRKMDRLQSNVKETADFNKTMATSWRLPFLILVVIIVAAGVALWMFYQKIRKMHLL